MGKSNRIRNKRASSALSSGMKPEKKSQGMPSWAMNLIAIAIIVFVVVSITLTLLSANGVFGRISTAMESENFRVSANVMQYFYTQAAQDAEKDDTVDDVIKQTKADVTELLVLCEEAHKRGITLDEADEETIKFELEYLKMFADAYGYGSTNALIASTYGAGITKTDVKDALELTILADKCRDVMSDELFELIDDGRIDAEYLENKDKYDCVDYAYYTFGVTYSDAVNKVFEGAEKAPTDEEKKAKEAEILETYKELIADAKAEAEILKAITDLDQFKDYILDKHLDEFYTEVYEEYIVDGEVKAEELPTEDELKTLREKGIALIRDLVKTEKDYVEEDVIKEFEGDKSKKTIFDITVTETFAENYNNIMRDLIDDVITGMENNVLEGAKYVETDEGIKWAFAEGENGRVAGDIATFEKGDGANGEAFAEEAKGLKSFEIGVYYSIKPRYRDETLSRDVAIMDFSTEAAAKAAIEKLKAGVTIEEFEDVCEELTGYYNHYENYAEGTISVVDSWLYDEDTKIGAYTTEPIVKTKDSSYLVVLYVADAEAVWYIDVRASILEEDLENAVKALEDTYKVTANDKAIAKIVE